MTDGPSQQHPVPVVHIITLLELGGAQQNTLHTLRSLDRTRYRPVLIAGEGGMLDHEARALPDTDVHFLSQLDRPIHPLKDLAATSAIAAILKDLSSQGPVITHTHSSKAGVVGRWAANRARVGPVIHSIHGFGQPAIASPWVRWIATAMERKLAKTTDAFISVAQTHVEEGKKKGLVGDRPVHVIRSGIDLEAFGRADEHRKQIRESLGWDADTPVVGTIANFKPQKAPLDFIALAAKVAKERPDARFFFAGDGTLRSEVETACTSHGLDDRLLLLGWRQDVPALFGALDVFVLTSRWEGLPRVCPQAMAAGKPVVATNVDGIPEAIVDGVNGHLFSPGETSAGARHVLDLLNDAKARKTLGKAGREAVKPFDQDLMVRQQEDLYASLLEDQPRGAQSR
ncbi:MAG: glycosyltransferase family 4 protein [Planctomycetota bacterium]|nr:glycosyltransferase family 4 protein [Planctomycetota bacterium]